jgi:hypothetical protein
MLISRKGEDAKLFGAFPLGLCVRQCIPGALVFIGFRKEDQNMNPTNTISQRAPIAAMRNLPLVAKNDPKKCARRARTKMRTSVRPRYLFFEIRATGQMARVAFLRRANQKESSGQRQATGDRGQGSGFTLSPTLPLSHSPRSLFPPSHRPTLRRLEATATSTNISPICACIPSISYKETRSTLNQKQRRKPSLTAVNAT